MRKFSFLLLLVGSVLYGEQRCDDVAYQAMGAFMEDAAARHKWIPFSLGGSFEEKEIERICLTFVLHQKVSLERARLLLLEGVEDLLEFLKGNVETQGFLKADFGSAHVDYGLLFVDKTYQPYEENLIYASLIKGVIAYYSMGKNGQLQVIKNEEIGEGV